MNQVTVLFFATLKDRAGIKKMSIDLPEDIYVRDLKALLKVRFPGLTEAMGTALVSVNREFAFDDDLIPMGAEIAVFPPVSGGSDGISLKGDFPTIFAITLEELDVNELLAQITLPSTGAVCLFTGLVRGVTTRDDPHETVYLDYEAYQPMAEAKLRQVAEELRERWPSVQGIAIVQRIGRLTPGTPTVIVACSAAHRDTGIFEAARYGIDRLKEIVPVWKKEVSPQGEEWVEGEYAPKRSD
jgi:molybdopterin synthase catalytic subunit/molybdopterin converting factor small subunit